MSWQILFDPRALRELDELDRGTRDRIWKFLYKRLARLDDPRSVGQALRGSELGDLWKYRVGDYRIFARSRRQGSPSRGRRGRTQERSLPVTLEKRELFPTELSLPTGTSLSRSEPSWWAEPPTCLGSARVRTTWTLSGVPRLRDFSVKSSTLPRPLAFSLGTSRRYLRQAGHSGSPQLPAATRAWDATLHSASTPQLFHAHFDHTSPWSSRHGPSALSPGTQGTCVLARATLAASSDSGVAFVVGTVPHVADSAKRVKKITARSLRLKSLRLESLRLESFGCLRLHLTA